MGEMLRTAKFPQPSSWRLRRRTPPRLSPVLPLQNSSPHSHHFPGLRSVFELDACSHHPPEVKHCRECRIHQPQRRLLRLCFGVAAFCEDEHCFLRFSLIDDCALNPETSFAVAGSIYFLLWRESYGPIPTCLHIRCNIKQE